MPKLMLCVKSVIRNKKNPNINESFVDPSQSDRLVMSQF